VPRNTGGMKRSEAVALVAAAVLQAPVAVRAQQARPKLRVGANPGESLAEGLYATDGGFFTKAGIDAETVTLPNGGAMTAAIVGGAVDIAPSNIASIAAAHAHGLQLNLFAPSTVVSSAVPATTQIVVLKDSPLRAPKDFVGKTFALSTLRDLQQAAVMTWLDKNGVDSKAVNFTEIVPPEMMPALAAKRVDAAVLVEPFLSSSRADVREIARPYDALGSHLLTFGFIANKGWYDANPPLVPKVVAVIRQTAVWANHDHAGTAAILARALKMTPESFANLNRQSYEEGKLDPAAIQPIIDAAAHYGFLPRDFPASELFAPNAG
jgi:NitT/TauT family transport system substrate-binding protein